ncbi:CRISPR-associated protein Cas1 [Azospirillum fermentarium]|uniref:type I-E CRISPR-associated endonuclease Cas1e n=1 Tax=Azospirillum fermentarium TaxID=1233114 RepID=UPI0022279EE5|nr:type I-E CRISPR-associated endonuclease Cas1e [Azospirillum fermentarium]MCW2247014.1 CRISPR-associated protein Cas1 [Azospirillum fermentarium]
MLKGRLGLDEARIPQKSRNGLLYVERCRLTIDNGSLVLAFDDKGEEVELPYQRLNAVLMGPGSSVTHDAMRHCSAHGTCVAFVGTGGTRIYTAPPVFDRDSTLARQQAAWWASETTRIMVAKRMYAKRFGETPRVTSLDSLRGMEAARIKRSYELIAAQAGIVWNGRRFDRANPGAADLPNQAINHVVTALESCVAIAVQATGTLPPLGFLHEDSAKSWILDLCDLYRTTVTVPLAFGCVKRVEEGEAESLDRLCRRAVSKHVRKNAFVDTVIDDIHAMLS